MSTKAAGWSISAKVGALVAILVAFTLLTGIGYQLLVTDVKDLGVSQTTTAMMGSYKRELKNLVDAQASQLAPLLQETTDVEAQKALIVSALKAVRFDKDKSGYFFAYTQDGTVITVPTNPALAGQNLVERQDKKGNFFVKNLIAAAEKGGDFTEYYFPKTADGPPLAKLAYATYIPGTKLWIGTGVYTDDVGVEKTTVLTAIESATSSYLTKLYLIIGVAFLLAVVPLTLLLVRSIVRPVGILTNAVHQASTGRVDIHIDGDFGGELARLKEAVLELVEKMQQRSQVAQAIADGDLSMTVPVDSEHDVLGKAMRTMTDRLNDLMGQINVAGEQITSGATQVSDSSQTLSHGATQQAAAIQEISASMQQLASQTRQNAENAGVAKKLGDEMQTAAGRGTGQMESMVRAMHEINQAGQNISNIIKTIDEIAFQTNLLALNAAVEAARAGQHGKGFAVVAEEVRNLAARSAKAASETAGLIESSVKKGETGVDIANRTAAALNEIVSGITKSNDLVGEIAASSNEQAEGIAQINQGLQQIDQVTQQNTATAEESAAAAEELSSQTAHLQGMLKQFRLRPGMGGMSSAPTYRPAPKPAPKPAPRPAVRPLAPAKPAARPAAKALPAPKPAARPTPAPAPSGTWGGVASPPSGKPKVQIALDDDEFGKY